MNKNVRIAFQLRHKDDSNSRGIGDLSYSDFQWNKRRYLYHSNGNNEYVLFKDDITDDINKMIDEIIVRGKDKELLYDPCLVYLYQFDDNGNSYYSDTVNQKWKDWMKANYGKTKPHQLYTYTDGLEVGCTPFLHERCVFTTIRFTGDTKDYADIGKLSEALINQFINIENNLTFRVVKLYDYCMKIAHDLHLLDVNQDFKLTNVWSRMSDVMGQADEVALWIPTIDYYMDLRKEYEINLKTSDPNYLYKYELISPSKKSPVYRTTVAAEKTGVGTTVSGFTNSFAASGTATVSSGWINDPGNDELLLARVGSVLSINTDMTKGNIDDISISIRVYNRFEKSKYVEKSIRWGSGNNATGSFTQSWTFTQADIDRLGGSDKFVSFAINTTINSGTEAAGVYSIIKFTGWKKNTTVFAELNHTAQGQLMDGYINVGDQTESTTTETRPDLYLNNNSNYSYKNEYSTVYQTAMRGDNDHKINRVRGSVRISGMRPASEWLTSPTLKTDVLCYNMSGSLVKTLTAQYGHNTIGGTKTAENKGNWTQNPGPWDRQMNCEASFDIGGQDVIHIGVNSNVIIKYNRDHHSTSGTTMRRYDGTMMSGTNQGWREGNDWGSNIGIPAAPANVNTSSLSGIKGSNLYVAVNVSDIPNNGEYKQVWSRHVNNYVAGNLYAYLYVKRTGLTATVLFRYSWQDGGNGRDIHRYSFYTKIGVYTSYPSSNMMLLRPSDSGKTFNFDFNLGGLFKVIVKHTATWGTYNSGTYGTLQSFSCNDICTGNTTYYLPDKVNIPSIFTPLNNDCTIMIRGGQTYKVISQAQDLICNQLGIHKVRESVIDVKYLNTMFYGNDLILTQDFIIRTGSGRALRMDTMGTPAKTSRIVSGVPSAQHTMDIRKPILRRNMVNDPFFTKPESETGMGYISRLILSRPYILEEFSNKWLTITCKSGEEISFKLEYISDSEWSSLYSNDKQRVYGFIKDKELFIMTYYIDTAKVVINHQTGNTMEFILRDYDTNEITHSFSLLPYKPENGIPVKVNNEIYYLELDTDVPSHNQSADPVVFRDANDKFIGYLK